MSARTRAPSSAEKELRALSKRRSTAPEDSLTWSLQALLVRHEAYIADAEAERARMGAHIASLEASNHELESKNTFLTETNRHLEDRVDDVNKAVADAEDHIQGLAATLKSTQRELERVTRISKRTEGLEAQLLDFERSQAQLQATLAKTEKEERTMQQNWQASQRRVVELEQQMEEIEKEAGQERAAHKEEIARLERRKVVEDDLEHRNITPPQQPGHERQGSEVVSSFVKEILQDNANMQLAMSELREMLALYKDAAHQPPSPESPSELELPVHETRRSVSLGDELALTAEQKRQEYHVHHHYHGPPQRAVGLPQLARPVRKKRPAFGSSRSSGRSTPINTPFERPMIRHKATSSTSSSTFSNDGRTLRQNKRWSAQSFQTDSSLTSNTTSPESTSYRHSTIFERAYDDDDGETESTRATSPEWSPVVHAQRHKVSASLQTLALSSSDPPSPDLHSSQTTIFRVPDVPDPPATQPSLENIPSASHDIDPPNPPIHRGLRRTDSHASLVSISGMDIHITSAQAPPPSSLPYAMASNRQHSSPKITSTTASATSRTSTSSRSSSALKGRLATVAEDRYDPLAHTFGGFKRLGGLFSGRWGASGPAAAASPKRKAVVAPAPTANHAASASSAGDLVDVFVKVAETAQSAGPAPSTTVADTRDEAVGTDTQSDVTPADTASIMTTTSAPAAAPPASLPSQPQPDGTSKASTPTASTATTPKAKSAKPARPDLLYRPSGINQPGGLPPLPRPKARTVIMKSLDEDALRECLDE